MGNGEHWTLYVCPACGAGPFDRDPAEEHAAEDCDPDTWPWEAIEVVPASHLRGAVEALQSLRAAWDQHMATCPQHATLPSFDEITAWMNAPSNTASGGQYEAAPPNKQAKTEDQ